MNRRFNACRMLTCLFTLALLASPAWLVACAGKTHEEHTDAASARWKQVRSQMILDEAVSRFNAGDLDTAERSVGEALNLHPSDPRMYTLLGRIALERGHLDRANQLFQNALEVDQNHPEAHYYRGIVLQRWERHEDAYESYRNAWHLVQDNPAFLLASAEMLLELDREDEALELLESRLVYFEGNAALRAALGQIHLMRGEIGQAIEYYRRATVLAPDDTTIREELALAKMAGGRHDAAINTFEKLSEHPETRDRRDIQFSLVRAYLAHGRANDARNVLLNLANDRPTDTSVWIKLGEACWYADDMAGALRAAERVIDLAPRRHEGYLLAGMVWKKRGDLERALESLDRAAGAATDQAAPLILRGLTLEDAGRPRAAMRAYREALERHPEHPRASALLQRLADAHDVDELQRP